MVEPIGEKRVRVRKRVFLAKLTWDPPMQGKWISRMQALLEKLEQRGTNEAREHLNKIRAGWADVAGGRTFTIYEYDANLTREEFNNPWYGPFAFTDIARLEMIPVTTVEHLMGVLKKGSPFLEK